MTLRTKAILIVGLALIVTMGLIYATSRVTFIRGLQEIENRAVSKSVNQALGALAYLTANLETTTADWASWDDTYAFIEDKNEEYIQSNLVDDTFITLKLNLMLFIDSSGQLVFAKAFDLQNEEETSIPAGLTDYFIGNNPLLSQQDQQNIISGILPLSSGPMLVTSQPILTSNDEGPSRGTLVFGRYLDFNTINELSQVTLTPITVRSVRELPGTDFEKAYSALLLGQQIFISPLDREHVSGYSLIRDISDRPVFVLRVDSPRDTYQLGQLAVSYYILAILGVGIIIGVSTLALVQKQILSRFTTLTRGINRIATSTDTSTRITLGGQDELSLVAGTINGMLAALEESATEIRESEARYRDLFENTSDIILSVTPDGHFLYVNDAWHQALGYSQDDILELKIWDIIHPDSLPYFEKVFQTVLSGETVDNIESTFMTKDETTIIVEGNAGIQSRDGRVIAVRGIFHDISELKQTAERLQTLYQNERQLREQLEEEIKKRIEFTRALVHELKTPITPVLAAAELLLEELKDERLTRLAQSIERGAFNLNQRIDELLDLARGETDMLHLDVDTVDMTALLTDIGYEMLPLTGQFGQTLNVELAADLPEITGDRARLRQIIMNLLNNACKFTPPGGKITLKARCEKSNLVVEIADTGLGISKEDQVRLFEPYYRRIGDRERLSGLGLGLALAKRLVEMHGGRIWVKSRKGQGSTFGFSIPLTAPPTQETGKEPTSQKEVS